MTLEAPHYRQFGQGIRVALDHEIFFAVSVIKYIIHSDFPIPMNIVVEDPLTSIFVAYNYFTFVVKFLIVENQSFFVGSDSNAQHLEFAMKDIKDIL